MIRRFGVHLPLLWAGLGVAVVSGHHVAALVAMALVLAGVVRGPAVTPGESVEVMLSTFAVLLAGALAWLLPERTSLLGLRTPGAFYVTLMLGALFLAALRVHLNAPLGGARATVALALVAVVGVGSVSSAALYAPFLLGSALAVVLALRLADPGRPPLSALGVRGLVLGGLAMVGALGVAAELARLLPPLSDRVQAFAMENLDFDSSLRRSGFSRALELGTLRRITSSESKVFRVYGEGADHLRGVVYTVYGAGRWFVPRSAPRRVSVGRAAPAGPHVEIQSIGDETAAYFVPLEAHGVAAPDGLADVDEAGLYVPPNGAPAERVWFVPGEGEDRAPVAAPTPEDLLVPKVIAPRLRGLAAEWTRGATTAREKLDRIQRHLASGYEYSLEITRDEAKEPIVEFLFERKTGHCEYFATSMALLARTSSVAARVVGGFLVTERSPYGDYWIVRQSNAHAWVEAWIDGAWTTWDPTPAAALADQMAHRASSVEALADLAAREVRRTFEWLKLRTAGQLIMALALGLLFVFRAELRALLRPKPKPEVTAPRYRDPWPEVEALLARLAKDGEAPRVGETLVAFARRIGDAEMAAVLERYEAARFGGVEGEAAEEEEELRREIGGMRSGRG